MPEPLDTLTQNLHSMTKSLDIIYALEGLKKVSRIIVPEENIEQIKIFLGNLGLKVSISNFKVKKESDFLRGYSDKGFILDKNSREKGNFFVYASRDSESVEKAKIFEDKNDHASLGKILGYPDCCVKFFSENFLIESKRKNDYILPALKNSSGWKFPFVNNAAIRHMDISLLSNFPCSFGCEESREIGRKNFQMIEKISPDISKIFSEMLKCPVIYTENEGISILRGAEIFENKIKYKSFIGSARSNLYNLIANNHEIYVYEKNSFSVGNVTIKGDFFGVMVFE